MQSESTDELHRLLEPAIEVYDIDKVSRILEHVNIDKLMPGKKVTLLSHICSQMPAQFE